MHTLVFSAMPNILFQSTNLTLRRFTVDDAAFIFELLNTPTWKQFIGERNINTHDDAVNYVINGPYVLYNKYHYGPWLVSLKPNNQPIGMCGLFKREYLDAPDLGFAYLPEFEGRGLAYEACLATLQHVKHTYQVGTLYATTVETNVRSRRLLERCGFTENGVISPPGDDTLLLYKLILTTS
jgi:ribosomal-protein-alanine N-acetyltransferase